MTDKHCIAQMAKDIYLLQTAPAVTVEQCIAKAVEIFDGVDKYVNSDDSNQAGKRKWPRNVK